MTHDVTAPSSSGRAAVDAFFEAKRLQRQQQAAGGRLIFALDATASRQPTWDLACGLQADMFTSIAGLDVQLIFYRADECKASRWYSDGRALGDVMRRIDCRSGSTQIKRVLVHAQKENARRNVAALVFVGDAMEETPDDLYAIARELGLPCFLFQEGNDDHVAGVFAEIARLTGGAFCRFDQGSAAELAQLLRAVAVYAAGGVQALSHLSGNAGAVKLLQQLK